MSNRLRLATAGALILAACAVHAVGAAPRIVHHELITPRTQRGAGGAESLSFDAFGLHYQLQLSPNERVRRALPMAQRAITPLRGEVAGLPGSWVRLTRGADGSLEGMVSDGRQLYAIEPAARLRSLAVEPLPAAATAPVMYRLADYQDPAGLGVCGTDPPATDASAAQAYQALASELRDKAQSTAEPRLLRVAVVADSTFASYFAGSALDVVGQIVARMNVVDGIYASQMGIDIEVPTITVLDPGSDPFTGTDAHQLLGELREFRHDSALQLASGVTHLMTGRIMQNEIVGIAYVGAVCRGDASVSLSQGTRSVATAALIAAHEIGHNFNSPHDGVPGACASEPQTFLMAPRINGSSVFSACSLQQMHPDATQAVCLSDATPADAAVQVAATNITLPFNQPFTLAVVVGAQGEAASTDVVATALLPEQLSVGAVSAQGGSCSRGASAVSCTFGTLEAGALREIDLSVTPRRIGSYRIDLAVSSSNDSVASNNSASVAVGVIPANAPAIGPAPGAGSGGGALTPGALLGLALARLARSRAPQRRAPRSSVSTRT